MKILSNKKYNELLVKPLQGCFAQVNDDQLLRENGLLYAENKKLRSIIKEVREKVDNYDVFKEFTFPLMKRWEEQEVKSSIDYEWNEYIKNPILKILDKINSEFNSENE